MSFGLVGRAHPTFSEFEYIKGKIIGAHEWKLNAFASMAKMSQTTGGSGASFPIPVGVIGFGLMVNELLAKKEES